MPDPQARGALDAGVVDLEHASPEDADGAGTGSVAATPPQLESLEPLLIPEDMDVPDEALTATLLVGADGHAVIEASPAAPAVRALLDAIIARARFKPATVGGEPREARVQVRFSVAQPEATPPGKDIAVSARDTVIGEQVEGEYGARARIDPPPPTARSLSLEEMREVPGAFGDPFRVLDTLPGVVPVFSGLPYVYVRGAPPAGTSYVYDGIAVPALFHLALGPAVVHPAMIGDLEFYSAVPPARYGRRTGGVFAAQGPALDPDAPINGEAELRLLDVQGMLNAKVGDGRLVVAGRYGYPGLLLTAVQSEAKLAYWDYQTRFDQALSEHLRFELTWFGSYDLAGSQNDSDSDVTLQFHRAELRLITFGDDYEIGLGLQGGQEESALGDTAAVEVLRFGPRLWSWFDLDSKTRLRAGADFQVLFGGLRDLRDDAPPEDSIEGSGLLADPYLVSVDNRQLAGAYLELDLAVTETVGLSPGLRFDTWVTGGDFQTALDPRLQLRYQASPALMLHVAGGLGHQLATLPVPLPGLADIGLQQGLQTSYQAEVGAALTSIETLRLEAELFLNHMTDLVLAEQVLACGEDDASPLCPQGDDTFSRGTVNAYGVELFVKRDASEDVSGWLSYTLGRAVGKTNGYDFTPEFDVRHVANLVLQWRIGGGFTLGGRLHYRSGKVYGTTLSLSSLGTLRYEQRMPGFFRADARLAYAWRPSWGRMRIALEWMNVTLSREPVGVSCDIPDDDYRAATSVNDAANFVTCKPVFAPAIFFPNLGLWAQF